MELDLSLVYGELQEIASQWEALGTEACLPPEVLESLRSDGCTEQDALREVLRHWSQNMKDAGKDMTWSLILKAVQNIDKKLTERLTKMYVSSAIEDTPEGDKEGEAELKSTQDEGRELEGGNQNEGTEDSTKNEGTAENTKNDGTEENTTKNDGTEENTTKNDGTEENTTKNEDTEENITKNEGTEENTTMNDGTEESSKSVGAEGNETSQEEKMEVDGEEAAGGEDDGGDRDGGTSSTENAHVFTADWSKLPKDEIVDRVRGMIYGQAIGDALGLGTEFMFKKEAHGYYKKGIKSYDEIVHDFHRSRWDKGDWTDDTDQMLLIMLMLIERNGKVSQKDFAARLHNWMLHGFKEFGDLGGMGIGMTVSRTLRHPKFLEEPAKAAEEVWVASGRYLAANGAIMRTSILGALQFNNIPAVVANTAEIARVTHADPRCSASSVAVTTAIALMLQGNYNISKKDQLKKLIEEATEAGTKLLEHQDQVKEMKKHIDSSLKDLKLDEQQSIGYTFKAMGAGFYGLRKVKNFRETITEVIMEGGDADSNAAVCGALMGCKVGFKALPEDLLKFPHRDWLDTQVDRFLRTIGLA